jgi:hypothetical protein
MHRQDLKTWVRPTDYVVSRNARKIAKWKRDLLGEGEEAVGGAEKGV